MKSYETKSKLILHFLKGAKRYFLLSACFALLVSFLDMVNPRIISFAVDSVIGEERADSAGFIVRVFDRLGGTGYLREHLWVIALAVGLIGILAACCRYLFRVCNARGAERFVKRMRDELFAHIMYLPYAWLGENSTGDIIQRCTSDVQTLNSFIPEKTATLYTTSIFFC